MKIIEKDYPPVIYQYKDKVFSSLRDTEKGKYYYEIRSDNKYELLQRYELEFPLAHLSYGNGFVIVNNNFDKYIFNLNDLEVANVRCKYSILHKIKGGFLGMDLQKRNTLFLDEKLIVINRFAMHSFWIKSATCTVTKITGGHSRLEVRSCIDGSLFWKKTYKGSITIKNSSEKWFVLNVREENKDYVQVIESLTGLLKYEENMSLGNVYFDNSCETVFLGYYKGMKELCLRYFKIINDFLYPRKSYMNAFVGVSNECLMYNGRAKENYFGLIDRKSGECLWEYDYIPPNGRVLNIQKWVPLKNGNHIISYLIPKNSAVFEFMP